MGNSATIFAQKNKPIYGRFIFRSTFAGISFPCVDYLFDYLMITELPKRPIYRHFQEQIAGIEPVSPAWEASVLPMNYICRILLCYIHRHSCECSNIIAYVTGKVKPYTSFTVSHSAFWVTYCSLSQSAACSTPTGLNSNSFRCFNSWSVLANP